MRVAVSGTSSRCFTVSPALISFFGFGWLRLLFLFGLCLVFCLVALFGLLPPRMRSFGIF